MTLALAFWVTFSVWSLLGAASFALPMDSKVHGYAPSLIPWLLFLLAGIKLFGLPIHG